MKLELKGKPAQFHAKIQSIRHIDFITQKCLVPNQRHASSFFFPLLGDDRHEREGEG